MIQEYKHNDLLRDRVELTIKLPLKKQDQLLVICYAHKTIKGWLIERLELGLNGRTIIEAYRISDDYRKFLYNCRIEDLKQY